LFDKATNAASSLLESKLEEILDAEKKWFLEIEQIKVKQRTVKWKFNQMAKKFLYKCK
jgi:hypothetical protein